MNAPARRFLDQMGSAAENDGFPRIAGRLFGALLLSEEPCSLDALAERLGASKASVSTDARRLLERGIAERHTRPGDRRDYYQLAPDFLDRLVRHRLARWSTLQHLAGELRASSPTLPPMLGERLAYIDAFHGFVLARVEEALDDWERLRRTPAPRAPRRARRSGAA